MGAAVGDQLQQSDGAAFAMRDLIESALARRFVGTPTHDFRAVPKTSAGKMIVGDFDNDFRIDRFPFAAAFGTPAARTAGRVAGETGRFA